MKNKIKIQKNKGAAMIIVVLFFMFISLTILVGIVTPVVREFKTASDNFDSKQSYFTAESGVEDVFYRLRNRKQIDNTETLILGDSQVMTTINDLVDNQKEIISLADTDSIQRKVNMIIDTSIGAAFSYGVQIGMGGFSMDNGSQIIGSVYSNGSISGSGIITGSATSANSPALTSDQSNGEGVPDYDIIFGKTDIAQDFAQSFQVSETGVLNKIQLYIKKVETPSNITIRIVTNSSDGPSTTTLASATLSSSLVSTNYGIVDVPLTSHIQLSSGITYWLVLDASTSSAEYYKIGANNNGYDNGTGKIGRYSGTWNNTTPSELDSFFSIYLGGLTGLISGVTVGTGSVGNTYAHTVNNAIIRGINYCKTGSGNNKDCDTSKTDPVQVAMPISEQNIQDWKDVATQGGAIIGDYIISSDATLGPKKITGNLTVNNKSTLTVDGIIWVQGNLLVDNNSTLKLSSRYESSEGVIIVDGTINIENNGKFEGSGVNGSYMMALTTSSSSSAINVSNNAGAVTLYAANGTINLSPNGKAISLTGYYIHLNNNAIVEYQEGLANANFISGPTGSWNIFSWKEAE